MRRNDVIDHIGALGGCCVYCGGSGAAGGGCMWYCGGAPYCGGGTPNCGGGGPLEFGGGIGYNWAYCGAY